MMIIEKIYPLTVFWIAAFLIFYHHALFPLLAKYLARLLLFLNKSSPVTPILVPVGLKDLPHITIVVPAYNEAEFIERKIENLAALDYPVQKLDIVIVSDGSCDSTVFLARKALKNHPQLSASIKDFSSNRGKVAVLNEVIPPLATDLIVLTDVSATVGKDALMRLSSHFADSRIGVVSGTYQLRKSGSAGEALYWRHQTALKRDEDIIGAIMGAHGAFYALRALLFEPLEPDTINDDFILPMRIIAKGFDSFYDTQLVALEQEQTDLRQDFNRRVRISAGGMQQIVRLSKLFDPRRPGIAFVFASGKALRVLCPFLLAAMFITSIALVAIGETAYFLTLTGLGALLVLGLVQIHGHLVKLPKVLHPFAYLSAGYIAGLVGGVRFFCGLEQGRWTKASNCISDRAEENRDHIRSIDFLTPATRFSKRAFDITVAGFAFILFIIVFPILAVLIKLDSRGPIFYRQLRVGRRTQQQTQLFLLTKFRTMRQDAESETGAVWAAKNDPRITRFGFFLRKTRLDEFPQCLNVLAGDMSIVGPRPERPAFFAKLEREIPYYTERTCGLRPGITGLAQVTTGYDESVEDVREKVLHDHVYATRLSRLRDWFLTDISICFRTLMVMILGKGQ